MRILFPFFLLASIVVSGVQPVHAALGIAPRCLPSGSIPGKTSGVKLPITELSPALPSYDPEDRDYLIRTIAFEAPEEPDEGKAAVAYVIINRNRSGNFGDNIKEVVTRPWQFEPWMTRRKEIET